jgi:hypothetical protein
VPADAPGGEGGEAVGGGVVLSVPVVDEVHQRARVLVPVVPGMGKQSVSAQWTSVVSTKEKEKSTLEVGDSSLTVCRPRTRRRPPRSAAGRSDLHLLCCGGEW